jgi:hypothetical protein
VARPWRTKDKKLGEIARRALLALVGAPQVLLDSGVGLAAFTKTTINYNNE